MDPMMTTLAVLFARTTVFAVSEMGAICVVIGGIQAGYDVRRRWVWTVGLAAAVINFLAVGPRRADLALPPLPMSAAVMMFVGFSIAAWIGYGIVRFVRTFMTRQSSS